MLEAYGRARSADRQRDPRRHTGSRGAGALVCIVPPTLTLARKRGRESMFLNPLPATGKGKGWCPAASRFATAGRRAYFGENGCFTELRLATTSDGCGSPRTARSIDSLVAL